MTDTSADGSLRFENRPPTPDRQPAQPGSTAWIWDAVTGETLADGTAWTSSRVTPQSDGTLLLALYHYNREALFRLDPATRTFRTLGERRPEESFRQLAAAIGRAHQASLDKANTYLGLRLAPDDSLRVELAAVEWSNSHWVNSPRVIEVATGRILLDLWNTDWDAEPSFPHERCVSLALRRYRSRIQLRALLDLAHNTFTIDEQDPHPPLLGPLAEIAPALEAASLRAAPSNDEAPPLRRAAPSATHRGTPRPIGPHQLLVAALILIGALATIGAISFLVVHLHPRPPQQLTPLPKPPPAR